MSHFLLNKSVSCQKGCKLAHTGQSPDNDCDLNCGAGWNYMEGVGKSMCNYDNHNGGDGVTVDDDNNIYGKVMFSGYHGFLD